MLETRALHALLRYRDTSQTPFRRITPAMRADLLQWAPKLSDEDLLDMRDVGPVMLRWIREHQILSADQAGPTESQAGVSTTFALVLKRQGWRVELFWNQSADWFTARLVSMVDREGNASYRGGYLVPFDDPIGVSGSTPEEAIANLSDAVLEWA